MFIVAHANHPELFVAGIAVGAIIALAQMAWTQAQAKK